MESTRSTFLECKVFIVNHMLVFHQYDFLIWDVIILDFFSLKYMSESDFSFFHVMSLNAVFERKKSGKTI